MIESLPVLQTAVWTLKTAREFFHEVTEHKDRCFALIDRSEKLIVLTCEQLSPGSPAQLDREVIKVKDACQAVKEMTMHLANMSRVRVWFNRDETEQKIKKAEQLLDDAFRNFYIGANAKHIRLQEELGRALKQDRQQLFSCLDHLLKTKNTLAEEIESVPSMSPIHNMPCTNSSAFPYPSLITPASSMSWHIRSDMVHQIDGGDPLPKGTVGQVHRGGMRGNIVAVKYLHEDTVKVLLTRRSTAESFKSRIRTWIGLSHRNVNTFIGACLEGEQPFLVTKFCANGNVMEYIQRFPQCNELSILHQVSAGMLFLHGNNIIHANLKPGNILVHEDHCVVVQDHEVARLKDDATLSASISRHNTIGTWNFMAPEYLDGEADYPADVYSFAMSAWQIHTGCVPFSRIPWRQLRKHIDTERPERPSSMNDQLWTYLELCWIKEPSTRMNFAEIELCLRTLLDIQRMHMPPDVETHPPTSETSYDEIHSPGGEALRLNVNTTQVPPTLSMPTPTSPVKSTASTKSFSANRCSASYSLSERGTGAIRKVIHLLADPPSLENLIKEMLLSYPSWLKANDNPNNRMGHIPHVYQNSGTRSAIEKLRVEISTWVNHLYNENVPISDPRRMLHYMTVICIMAEQAFRQKRGALEHHVKNFLELSLPRSDFKNYLEQACTTIWSKHKDSNFTHTDSVCHEITLVVEEGCCMLTSS